MSKIFSIPALVIRSQDYGENDKLLTLLSSEKGKISLIVKGGKSLRNKNMVCSQLLCYSEFQLSEKNGFYCLSEAYLIEQFYNLRLDIVRNAGAQYAADVAGEVCVQGSGDGDILNLTLNTLYMFSESDRNPDIIKAVFEMRCASLAGFMPDVTCCCKCGREHHPQMYLDVMNGVITCGECLGENDSAGAEGELSGATVILPMTSATLDAVRYVLYAPAKRIFSFSLPLEETENFTSVCEKYLINQLERGFTTLDFYKSVRGLG